MTEQEFKTKRQEIFDRNCGYGREFDKEFNALLREYYQDIKVGDGVTIHLWSDSQAYTVIKRTPKMLVLQRDKVTKKNGWKPEWIEGGFSAICINQEDQEWNYEIDPEGSILKVYWSEKRGAFTYCDKNVTPGRHEFYDYNF